MRLKDALILSAIVIVIGLLSGFSIYYTLYFDYEDYHMLLETTFKIAVTTGVTSGWTIYKSYKHRKNLTFHFRAKLVRQTLLLFFGTYAILQFFFWLF